MVTVQVQRRLAAQYESTTLAFQKFDTEGTGFLTFAKLTQGSCAPCSLNLAVAVSTIQLDDFRSHRSGRSDNIVMSSCASDSRFSPGIFRSSSVLKRSATAQVSPTASFMSSRISRVKRARFSRLPPYSSVRLFTEDNRNWYGPKFIPEYM